MHLTQFHSFKSEEQAQRLGPLPSFKNVPGGSPPAILSSLPENVKLTVSAVAAGRGSGPPPRPENKGDSQPLSSAAPSITSTSKAVACAVISTAGNVTTRPTAQTTTSARALVSGGAGHTAILRPSFAADVVPAPGPSPPRPSRAPGSRDGTRPGRSPRAARSGRRKGAEVATAWREARPPGCPSKKRAAEAQPDANCFQTAERLRAAPPALPPSTTREPQAGPPSSRHVSGVRLPRPSLLRARGGRQAAAGPPPAPRYQHHRRAGSARGNVQGSSHRGGHRLWFREEKPGHSLEVPGQPLPSGLRGEPPHFCRRGKKAKPRKLKARRRQVGRHRAVSARGHTPRLALRRSSACGRTIEIT